MARRKKQSISTFLISALGFLFMCKVFLWVLESRIMRVPINVPELNYAIYGVVLVLLIRFVWWMAQRKMATNKTAVDASSSLQVSDINDLNMCAACGKTVSEKVKQFCLNRPDRFQGKVYCYDHQSFH